MNAPSVTMAVKPRTYSRAQNAVLLVAAALALLGGGYLCLVPLSCVPFCRRAHPLVRAAGFTVGLLTALALVWFTPAGPAGQVTE